MFDIRTRPAPAAAYPPAPFVLSALYRSPIRNARRPRGDPFRETALRRPAGYQPRPEPCDRPAAGAGAAAALPGFLRRRYADGAGLRAPPPQAAATPAAVIRGFDPRQDVLVLVLAGNAPAPRLRLSRGDLPDAIVLSANGKPVAILPGAGPGFTLANVVVSRSPA